MKKWIAPAMQELNFKLTATAGLEDEISGMITPQEDLGTCHCAFWEGNGLTQEEAKENNPYYSGGWGSDGGWGADGGWGSK